MSFSRGRALVLGSFVAAVVLTGCAATPSALPAPTSPSTPASSASPSAAPSAPAVPVEPIALSVAQSYLGFAAQESRTRRGLGENDADAKLFSALRKSKRDWLDAAPRLVEEAQLQKVQVLVEGQDPETLRPGELVVSDGISVTVFNASQECTVMANFVKTDSGDTAMSWSAPECAAP